MSNDSNSAISNYFRQWISLFDRVWFTPAAPQVLSLIRLLAGAVILYTHFAWTRELKTFFGSESIIPSSYRADLNTGVSFAWSHFDWLPNDHWLIPVHIVVLTIMFLFMIGAWTRIMGLLTAFFVLSYANRAVGALFGLDQINCFLAFYLAIGPAGAAYSVDAWWRARKGRGGALPSVMANISLRLIQMHMCVVYFFAGVGKLQGDTWWNGTAIWLAFASNEYQTLDLTWTAEYLWFINILTYVSLFWEVSYPFLIWPKLTRPIWLALAVAVHLGIGIAMGMLTFGMIMIIANLSFWPRQWWPYPQRRWQVADISAK